MKLVYVNPENRGYRQLYIRLSWQFLLFGIAVNVFALIYQVLEQRHQVTNPDDQKNEFDIVVSNFSVQHDIAVSDVQKLFSDLKNSENDDNRTKKVTYMEGIIVTMSVFYTIGWGHVVPKTKQGKIFAMVSSCVGIPLTYLMVVTAAKILIRQMQDLISCISCGRSKECNNAVVSKQLLPYLIILFLAYTQISAGLIMISESFTYIDALYYSFITLTTVGFGDFAQTKMMSEDNILKAVGLTLFLFFWVLFGVVVVVANLLMIFSAKLKSRDVISIRYIKNIRRDGENIAIDTELEGKEMKTFSIIKGPDDESRKNLRYLFT